jgi:hypothetical protein
MYVYIGGEIKTILIITIIILFVFNDKYIMYIGHNKSSDFKELSKNAYLWKDLNFMQ